MHVHLVFVAKYRREVFDGDAIARLRVIFTKVCEDFEARLVEMDGENDHVHFAGGVPAQGGGLGAGEQPQGRVEPPAAT